ncbi:hypothetical protein D6779_03925 [Candidatus Parcubacteria bacterium]|nr:MAG: hypothetical protein D6779_03925 [Candidatus Parcubacteria bacterium]
MKRKSKWIRTETPDVFHLRVSISKDKYPELHKWLSELPMGSISETVRNALAYYMATGENVSASHKEVDEPSAPPVDKRQPAPRSDDRAQEEQVASAKQPESPSPASTTHPEKSSPKKGAKKIPDHLLRAAEEYRVK